MTMALSPGTRIGVYEVTAKIGAGGMGEVYRARDTKLDRDVALKVLPEAFTADSERLARFEREAKVLASLNHPNIGAIHGLEESDEGQALVLELIEGPTLADRVAQGPIPLDEALPIATQIAEALEAAHEQGVIHRDLKPANVKVRDDGTVKVLDFGLAKALMPEAGADSASMSPTMSLTAAATQMGMVMGTAAYMAPEQAKGRPVDRRADVWSFGALLFEMLTGRRAFPGDDVSDTLATVLKFEPDWELLPASTPVSVRRLLRRCLVKDPQLRLREVGTAIVEMAEPDPEPVAAAAQPSGGGVPWRYALPGAVVMAALMFALGATWLTPPAPAPLSFNFMLPPGVTMPVHSVAVAPDGSFVVAGSMASERGRAQLYLRRLGSLDVEPIAGSEDGYWPFVSPDGAWVGFSTINALWRMPVGGGEPFKLLDLPYFAYGTWGPDDMIAFTEGGSLWQVPATGGDRELVVEGSPETTAYHRPEFLPGGEAVLLDGRTAEDETFVAAVDLTDGSVTRLVEDATDPIYLQGGRLVYSRADGLWATEFDLGTVSTNGRPAPVLRGVSRAGPGAGSDRVGAAQFGLSPGGTLAYRPAGEEGRSASLLWIDRDGLTQPLGSAASIENGRIFLARLSPDGERIVIDGRDDAGGSLWMYDTRSNIRAPFVVGYEASSPVWSPDGDWVYFSGNRGAGDSIYRKAASGIGDPEEIAPAEGQSLFPSSMSADGTRLLYEQEGQLWEIDVTEGASSARVVIEGGGEHREGALSPDGRHIAFRRRAGDSHAVWVRAVDGSGETQVSQLGGEQATWSPDGRELFYVDDGDLYVVDVRREPRLATGEPRLLVSGGFMESRGIVRYQPTADGLRFLVADESRANEDRREEITVVVGWGDQLTRTAGP